MGSHYAVTGGWDPSGSYANGETHSSHKASNGTYHSNGRADSTDSKRGSSPPPLSFEEFQKLKKQQPAKESDSER